MFLAVVLSSSLLLKVDDRDLLHATRDVAAECFDSEAARRYVPSADLKRVRSDILTACAPQVAAWENASAARQTMAQDRADVKAMLDRTLPWLADSSIATARAKWAKAHSARR